VVDIEIVPTPKTASPAKRSKNLKSNFRKSIDGTEMSKEGPIEYIPDDKKIKSVFKISDTVSKLKTVDSIFKMDMSTNVVSMKPSDFMSQSLQQLPAKKKPKPAGPALYDRKDSLVNKSM